MTNRNCCISIPGFQQVITWGFVLGFLLVNPLWAVEIAPRPDGAFVVTGKTYTAIVDAQGNFLSLKIGSVEFWDNAPPHKGGPFPGKSPAANVNLRGQVIAALNDQVRVEYTFDDTGVSVLTEGDTLRYRLKQQKVIAVGSDHEMEGVLFGLEKPGGFVRKVMVGEAAFAIVNQKGLENGFHIHRDTFAPQHLFMGGSVATLCKYRLECGVAAEAVEMLDWTVHGIGVQAPKTPGLFILPAVPHFPPLTIPQFGISLRNLVGAKTVAEIKAELADHYFKGKKLADKRLPVLVNSNTQPTITLGFPEVTEPGCYFLSLELRSHDQVFKRQSLGFIVDADHYRPTLTRPADFRTFWDAKLAAMRSVPFDAKLTEVAEKSTEVAAHYALELNLGNGQVYRTHLQAPRRPGKYLGRWYPLDKATDTNSVRIGLTFPEQATFSRWKSRDENNMLDCYLLALRLADYLRSRPDVDRVQLWGASRSGPINYCVAAWTRRVSLEWISTCQPAQGSPG